MPIKNALLFLHLFIVLLASCAAYAADPDVPMPASASEWRAAAIRDVEAGYEVTLANHAGVLDPHNPAFLANLEAARNHGEALAAKVSDGGGYYAALLGFSSRIHDGHAGVYPTFMFDAVKPVQWPGFIAAWRGDLFVYSADKNMARPGERIVSCDGRPARQLIEKNVFGFFGRMDEEGQWWSEARNLFIDFGNPFVKRPAHCVFERSGRRIDRKLKWRAMPDSIWSAFRESVAGEALPVGLTEPRTGLFWVAMPTFTPNDEERADYRAIYKQVQAQRERFLNADAVVIDLRRNQGGSSWWSRDFAAVLWGESRVKRRDEARNAGEEVWYRVSPDNIAHVHGLNEKYLSEGEEESARRMAKLEAKLRAAQAADKPYYIEKGESPAPVIEPFAEQSGDVKPFTRPVYVIVPGNCVSSCLDAVDYFKMFANTKLIGAPSSADSTYMEVRIATLPGGLARVVVPTKLYVNRPRANGEFYRPHIPVNDLLWTTGTFRKIIEHDLAGSR